MFKVYLSRNGGVWEEQRSFDTREDATEYADELSGLGETMVERSADGALFKTLGRLLVRKGEAAGVFIPFGDSPLESGIWEVREVMGELTLVRVGEQTMPDATYQALDLNHMVKNAVAELAALDAL